MKGIGFRLLFVLVPTLFFGVCMPYFAFAQEDSIDITTSSLGGSNIVSTYDVVDEIISYGDVVSYNKKSNVYILSNIRSDEDVFGVIVEKPVILHHRVNGSVPIAELGEVLINVTTINGPIYVGDILTTSMIPGKAQKADKEDSHIVAVARESFLGNSTTTINISGIEGDISVGQIRAFLTVGAADNLQKGENPLPNSQLSEATVLNIIQYIVAAFVAIGSVYIAFHNFIPNINEGVVSIGRNPRAKSSIQSMVVLNAVLIVLVSVAGFALSVAIILLPI